jgi:hypothetical protein
MLFTRAPSPVPPPRLHPDTACPADSSGATAGPPSPPADPHPRQDLDPGNSLLLILVRPNLTSFRRSHSGTFLSRAKAHIVIRAQRRAVSRGFSFQVSLGYPMHGSAAGDRADCDSPARAFPTSSCNLWELRFARPEGWRVVERLGKTSWNDTNGVGNKYCYLQM